MWLFEHCTDQEYISTTLLNNNNNNSNINMASAVLGVAQPLTTDLFFGNRCLRGSIHSRMIHMTMSRRGRGYPNCQGWSWVWELLVLISRTMYITMSRSTFRTKTEGRMNVLQWELLRMWWGRNWFLKQLIQWSSNIIIVLENNHLLDLDDAGLTTEGQQLTLVPSFLHLKRLFLTRDAR